MNTHMTEYEEVKAKLDQLLGAESLRLEIVDRATLERQAAESDRPCATIEQACVNYLRHSASAYDYLVRRLSCPDELGLTTKMERHVLSIERRQYVAALKKRILDEIADKYPWLKAECLRQKARDGVEDQPAEFVLPFGPFRGKKLREIETDYLIRLLGQGWVRKSFRTRIERHVAERQAGQLAGRDK